MHFSNTQVLTYAQRDSSRLKIFDRRLFGRDIHKKISVITNLAEISSNSLINLKHFFREY